MDTGEQRVPGRNRSPRGRSASSLSSTGARSPSARGRRERGRSLPARPPSLPRGVDPRQWTAMTGAGAQDSLLFSDEQLRKRCFTCASNLRSSVVYHLATSSGRLRCFGGTRPNACSRRACPSTLKRTDNSLFNERQSSYPALASICFTSMRCTKSCPRWNLLRTDEAKTKVWLTGRPKPHLARLPHCY